VFLWNGALAQTFRLFRQATEIADLFEEIAWFQAASTVYKLALAVAAKVRPNDSQAVFHLIRKLGLAAVDMCDFNAALQHFDAAQLVATQHNHCVVAAAATATATAAATLASAAVAVSADSWLAHAEAAAAATAAAAAAGHPAVAAAEHANEAAAPPQQLINVGLLESDRADVQYQRCDYKLSWTSVTTLCAARFGIYFVDCDFACRRLQVVHSPAVSSMVHSPAVSSMVHSPAVSLMHIAVLQRHASPMHALTDQRCAQETHTHRHTVAALRSGVGGLTACQLVLILRPVHSPNCAQCSLPSPFPGSKNLLPRVDTRAYALAASLTSPHPIPHAPTRMHTHTHMHTSICSHAWQHVAAKRGASKR
jgi:hypothetical protein